MGWVNRGCTLATCALLVVLAAQTRARGQDATASPPPAAAAPAEAAPARQPWREMKEQLPSGGDALSQPKPERIWYGWQTMLADAVGAGLIAFTGDKAWPAVTGFSMLVVASPVIHLANANPKSGVVSFGIRLGSAGLLLLGALLITDALFDDEGGDDDVRVAVGTISAILSSGGMLAALVIDASLLAFKAAPPKREDGQVHVTPLLDPLHGGYGLRLGVAL